MADTSQENNSLGASFINGKEPVEAIKFAYILALGIVAALMIFVHLVSDHMIKTQSESFHVLSLISRMQNRVERSNSFVRVIADPLLQRSVDGGDNRAILNMKEAKEYAGQLRDDIAFQIEPLDKITYLFINGPNKNSSINKTLDQFMNGPTKKLRDEAETYFLAVKHLLEALESDKIEPKDMFEFYQTMELLQMTVTFSLSQMELAYTTSVVLHLRKQAKVQNALILIIIAVLLLEARFIFLPLVRKVGDYHGTLLRQSLEDPLTGLKNRRAFVNGAEAELSKVRRLEVPFIIAMTDLDHFKSVNDTHGHDVGDKVLKHFAGLLNKSLREGDIIGRIGGEEFALVLYAGTTKQDAEKILKRLCETVAATPCKYKTKTGETDKLSYTVSIGYVVVPKELQDKGIDDYLKASDTGLYKAKERGRNCVVSVDL